VTLDVRWSFELKFFNSAAVKNVAAVFVYFFRIRIPCSTVRRTSKTRNEACWDNRIIMCRITHATHSNTECCQVKHTSSSYILLDISLCYCSHHLSLLFNAATVQSRYSRCLICMICAVRLCNGDTNIIYNTLCLKKSYFVVSDVKIFHWRYQRKKSLPPLMVW